MHIRKRVYDILDPGHRQGLLSKTVNGIIYSLIFLTVVAIILESVPSISQRWAAVFGWFELLIVLVFTAEYLLRVWCCVASPDYASPVRGRLKYVLSPMAMVDLLAVLPFYLHVATANMLFLRSVRFFRLFRVLRLGRYSTAFRVLGQVVYGKRAELLISAFLVFFLTVVFSIGMYYTEHEAQPQIFPDIPSSMFWTIATLTNMGHPDPATPLGKCLAAAIFLLGLAMLALPTGVLGAGFVEEFQNRHTASDCCPHCGKQLQPEKES